MGLVAVFFLDGNVDAMTGKAADSSVSVEYWLGNVFSPLPLTVTLQTTCITEV